MVSEPAGRGCLSPSLICASALQSCSLLLARRAFDLRLHPLEGQGRWFLRAWRGRGLALGTSRQRWCESRMLGVHRACCGMWWGSLWGYGASGVGVGQLSQRASQPGLGRFVHAAGMSHRARCSVSHAEAARSESAHVRRVFGSKQGRVLLGWAGRMRLQKAACGAGYLACEAAPLPVSGPLSR